MQMLHALEHRSVFVAMCAGHAGGGFIGLATHEEVTLLTEVNDAVCVWLIKRRVLLFVAVNVKVVMEEEFHHALLTIGRAHLPVTYENIVHRVHVVLHTHFESHLFAPDHRISHEGFWCIARFNVPVILAEPRKSFSFHHHSYAVHFVVGRLILHTDVRVVEVAHLQAIIEGREHLAVSENE